MAKRSIEYDGLVKMVPGFNCVTVPELLVKTAKECDNQPFIIYEDQEYTFNQIFELSNRFANLLISLGINKNDKVGIMLPNCPEHVIAFFGVEAAGAVELAINIDFRGDELAYILHHAEARVIITNNELLPHIQAVWQNNSKHAIISIDENKDQDIVDFWETIKLHSTQMPNIHIENDDPAQLIYTSGSTGFPKGALESHRYLTTYGAITDWSYRLTKRDKIMLITPLFHGVALWHGIMGALYMGLPCAIIRRFSVSKFFEDVKKYRSTIVYAIGAIPAMLYNQPPSDQDKDHDIRVMWAFMTPRHIFEDFEKRFNITIYDGLGQTEAGRILINYPPIRKPGSLGLPYELSDVKIVDEDDNEVAPGEVGEICVRAPLIMLEYYKNPEATDAAFKGGWHHTGDNGRIDEDGFVWFADRKKDIIRRRGKVISSFEVQNAINNHSKVLESACIAVPSDLAEEEILAAIVLKDAADPPEPEELAEWVKGQVAYYKVPRYWVYVDSLPKTPSLRIQKFKLKQTVSIDEAIEIPVTKPGEPIKRQGKRGECHSGA